MKKWSASFCLILILSSVVVMAGEWKGYISDANCAEKQGEDPNHKACALRCIGRGAAAVLVVEGKVYALDNQEDAKKFAGEKVVLKGTASEDGKSIKVDSIAKADGE